VPIGNFAESLDVLCRRYGVPLIELREAVGGLSAAGRIRILAPDVEAAWRAAALRQRYYAKRSSEVSLADCFLIAAAETGDEIATADPALAAAARAESIAVVALPDSNGRRP
jgi:predicted nucleic acid-binding protein